MAEDERRLAEAVHAKVAADSDPQTPEYGDTDGDLVGPHIGGSRSCISIRRRGEVCQRLTSQAPICPPDAESTKRPLDDRELALVAEGAAPAACSARRDGPKAAATTFQAATRSSRRALQT